MFIEKAVYGGVWTMSVTRLPMFLQEDKHRHSGRRAMRADQESRDCLANHVEIPGSMLRIAPE